MRENHPNKRLWHERELKGWSRRKLAELLETNEQVVYRWEKGKHIPSRHFQELLCTLFGKNGEELGFLDASLTTEEEAPNTRQSFLSSSTSGKELEETFPSQDGVRTESWLEDARSGFLPSQTVSALINMASTLSVSPIDPSKSGHLSYNPAPLPRTNEATPEALENFAVLTETCRSLSEGNELKTAERILWSYLPRVESLVQYTLREPQMAASIAAQGYLLAASLVGHHNDLHARQYCSEQALLYGEIAQDETLQVAVLRQLATTFGYLGLPHKVMQTYQRALPHIDNVPPLLRSCIYAALSGVCAQFQQRQNAYHFIGLAYESFGEHQGDEPAFLRAINASQNLLIHWDGKNHLYLGQPHLAEQVFMKLDVLDPNMKLPKRIRVEAINNRARMFIAVGNMEQACIYLERAVKIAAEIGSSLRLQEVAATFQSLKNTWPYEERVRRSGDLFIQYLINQGR